MNKGIKTSIAFVLLSFLVACSGPGQLGDIAPSERGQALNSDTNNPRFTNAELKGDSLVVSCSIHNTRVEIMEEPKEKKVHININGSTTVLPEAAVKKFDINLCGPSNSFKYQILGPSKTFRTPRYFVINGYNGIETIDFRMQTNSYGRPDISLDTNIHVEMNLRGGNDQVGIALNHIDKQGRFTLNTDLGEGQDGFSWRIERPVTWAGRVDAKVDAGAGDDQVLFALAQGLKVEKNGDAKFIVYGDRHHEINILDNEADHGTDTLLSSVRGVINGNFEMRFYGDDGIVRSADLACRRGSEACVFRETVNRPRACRTELTFKNAEFQEQCIDLENALKASSLYQAGLNTKYVQTQCRVPNVIYTEEIMASLPECSVEQLRSFHPIACRYPNESDLMGLPVCSAEFMSQLNYLRSYAKDTVQAKVVIQPGSGEGTSYFKMDGGLAGDYTALLYENLDNPDQPITRHRFELNGGQLHRFKHDVCWPELVRGIPSVNCDEFSDEIVHVDLEN